MSCYDFICIQGLNFKTTRGNYEWDPAAGKFHAWCWADTVFDSLFNVTLLLKISYVNWFQTRLKFSFKPLVFSNSLHRKLDVYILWQHWKYISFSLLSVKFFLPCNLRTCLKIQIFHRRKHFNASDVLHCKRYFSIDERVVFMNEILWRSRQKVFIGLHASASRVKCHWGMRLCYCLNVWCLMLKAAFDVKHQKWKLTAKNLIFSISSVEWHQTRFDSLSRQLSSSCKALHSSCRR